MQTPDHIMAAAEARMEIEPIHELHATRHALVEEVADYRAKYGAFGTFDAIRKAELSKIAYELRGKSVRDGVKMTEGAIAEAAHADPRYYDLITVATKERAEMALLEDRIQAIDETIMRAQAVARFLTNEARL